MTLPVPCLTCAQPTTNGTRCEDCARPLRREADRAKYARNGRRSRPERDKQSAAWERLSKRARALQPWCTDCLRYEDDLEPHARLETDHLPQAWARVYAGKPVRMQDVEVTCSKCNRARGPAKPGSARYEAWEREQAEAVAS